jgi:hypothetical protein
VERYLAEATTVATAAESVVQELTKALAQVFAMETLFSVVKVRE